MFYHQCGDKLICFKSKTDLFNSNRLEYYNSSLFKSATSLAELVIYSKCCEDL